MQASEPEKGRRYTDTGLAATELCAEYYAQRANKKSLLIVEASGVAPEAIGIPNNQAIFRQEHIQAWKKVMQSCRAKEPESVVILQLWHMGRLGHPDFQGGDLPWGPSNTPVPHKL